MQGKQPWILLVFLFALANFLEVAVLAHFVLFTPAFLEAIGFTANEINVWTGPIASMGFLLGIWFVPFWGVLADRYGRKPLILRSYYVDVAAMVLAAVSLSLWPYLIARALSGLALGNTGLMYASLTETAPRNRVALGLSLINGSAPLGGLVGALLGGLVVSQVGVHWLFAIDAVVAAMIAIVLTLGYRETFISKPMPRLTVMLGNALRTVIRSPVAVTIFLIGFVYNTAFFFSFAYLPVRIGEIVGPHAAPNAIGRIQGIAGMTTLLGSILWGALADRVGHHRLLALLMFAAMILWLPLFAAQGMIDLAMAWAIFSAVNPAVTSLMFTIISLSLPDSQRGSVLSMVYLPMNLAFIVGPFAASFVASNLEVRDVFLVSAALSLLALVILVANLKRTRGELNLATGSDVR